MIKLKTAMKKIIFLILILTFVIAAGCKKSSKDILQGAWKLSSVEGQKLTEDDLKTTLTFTEGKFDMVIPGDEEKKGTWELSADDKVLTAKNEKGEQEKWNISKLDEKEFVFSIDDNKEKITLIRQE